MDPLNFAYWLQGFAELHAEPPTADQWEAIKAHLQLVFQKVTPAMRQGVGQALPLPGIPFQGAQGNCGVNNPNANLIC